ncbi:hypothetical protein D3C81_691850 [compost metagenome]
MAIKIMNNLFEDILESFEEMYPDKSKMVVQFDPHMPGDETGYILVAEEENEFVDSFVFVNAKLSVESAVAALAEQLTDLVVEVDNEFVWKKTYNELMNSAEAKMQKRYDESNFKDFNFEVDE